MKLCRCSSMAVVLCVAFLLIPFVTRAADKPTLSTAERAGIEMAEKISMVTGVAISPLLGVGSVGAWKWFHAPSAQRAQLPWFAQPWFWVPALLLVAAVFAKDVLGTTLPASIKKPFDVAEAIENKISALVAAGAFVPIIASVSKVTTASVPLSDVGFAMIDFSWLLNLITVPVAMAAFVVVWLVAHTVNVLILISPFGALDAALKAFRLMILSTVTLTSFANPYVGAAWSLVLILVCYYLSGWAFRTTVFGTILVWDLLTFKHRRFRPAPVNWMFLARKLDKVPVRTFGRVSRDVNGRLTLKYRPWLVRAEETLVLPEGKYAIGRGLLYPELMLVGDEIPRTICRLPPRCRSHEEQLTQHYGLEPVQDVGFKAMWKWMKEVFGFKGERMPLPASG